MTEKPDAKPDVRLAPSKDDELRESFSDETLSPEEDGQLLRRIDLCLLPVMALSYLFQFLDKMALSSAAIMGIMGDLSLSGSEYSWASGIYYCGYLVASYPVAMIMVRWRVGKVIATSTFVWGTVLMLTAACFNSHSLLANRFFLGVSEAAIAPGLTLVVSMWYKRSEQPLRLAAWFLGNTSAGIFGSILAYAIGHIESMSPWKAVFLIFGAVTVAWSVAVFFLLPDIPMSAWFLSAEDRRKAVVRVKDNMTGIKTDDVKWEQVREAVLDVKTWLIAVLSISLNIPNGSVTTFANIVVKGFGFSTVDTLLLGSVSYILQLFLVLIGTGGSSYLHNTRTYFMAFNCAIAIVGAALVRSIDEDERWTRFVGTVLSSAYSANLPLLLSLVAGNCGGVTKKMTVNAILFVAYCGGNVIGPQLFFEDEAPTYQSGFSALIACFSIAFITCWLIRFYLARENRRRDRLVSADDVAALEETIHGVAVNLADLTDKEIPQFRYVY